MHCMALHAVNFGIRYNNGMCDKNLRWGWVRDSYCTKERSHRPVFSILYRKFPVESSLCLTGKRLRIKL